MRARRRKLQAAVMNKYLRHEPYGKIVVLGMSSRAEDCREVLETLPKRGTGAIPDSLILKHMAQCFDELNNPSTVFYLLLLSRNSIALYHDR